MVVENSLQAQELNSNASVVLLQFLKFLVLYLDKSPLIQPVIVAGSVVWMHTTQSVKLGSADGKLIKIMLLHRLVFA